jgi:hypothetical protein
VEIIIQYLISLDVYQKDGPTIQSHVCNKQDNKMWIWSPTDGTVRSKGNNVCIMVQPELEIWAGPLLGGSQAVVLLNRGDSVSEKIAVNWTDIGFPIDHPATIRDLRAHKDLGTFTGSYTSSNINSHAVMLLNITLTK